MDRYDINATVLGLRADESRVRKISFRKRGDEYYNRREEADILTPVARWTTDDVFQYAARENIPLHPVYGKKPGMGYDRRQVRVNTVFGVLSFLHDGDAVFLKRDYPETFQKLKGFIPRLRGSA